MTEITPTKLKSLISFIISESDHDLGAIELAKIVYLIDVENFKFAGQTITGEHYTRQEKGPLALNFTDAINEMDGYEVVVSVGKSRGTSQIPKRNHTKGERHRFSPILTSTEFAIARKILERVENLTPFEIQNLAYGTEPMIAIIEKEKVKNSGLLLGEKIDFSKVKQNVLINKWRVNMKAEEEPDKEFNDFLAKEREEIDELLSSLK